jgi:hypothetical protein
MSGTNFAVRGVRFEAAEAELVAEPEVENLDLRGEIDEISELRRLVAEISEPEPSSYLNYAWK